MYNNGLFLVIGDPQLDSFRFLFFFFKFYILGCNENPPQRASSTVGRGEQKYTITVWNKQVQ